MNIKIEHKKFDELSEIVNDDTTVSEFISNVNYKLPIFLDQNYHNVLVYNGKCDLISNEKETRYYNISSDIEIKSTNHKISMLDYLEINGNFDQLYMNCSYNSINDLNFFNRIGKNAIVFCTNIIFSFFVEMKYTVIDKNLFYVEYQEIKNNNYYKELKCCNIKISDLNVENRVNVFDSLNIAVENYMNSIKININVIDIQKTNILVLCADNRSIRNKKCEKIIKKILQEDFSFENCDFYFVGIDVTEDKPFIYNSYVQNISSNNKFDIVLLEHCPSFVVESNYSLIRNLVDNNGMIICPDYKELRKKHDLKIFSISSCKEYISYILS